MQVSFRNFGQKNFCSNNEINEQSDVLTSSYCDLQEICKPSIKQLFLVKDKFFHIIKKLLVNSDLGYTCVRKQNKNIFSKACLTFEIFSQG